MFFLHNIIQVSLVFNALCYFSTAKELPQSGIILPIGEIKQIQKRSAEITFSSNATTSSNAIKCQQTIMGQRRCEVYNYTHCREVADSFNTTTVSVNCSTSTDQARYEKILRDVYNLMKTTYRSSDDCLKASRWALCLYTFPGCSKNDPMKTPLCKEACILTRDIICRNEFRRVASLKEGHLISADIILPRCETFPSKEDTANLSCVYPDFLDDMKMMYSEKETADRKTTIIIASVSGCGIFFILIIACLTSARLKKTRQMRNAGKAVRMSSLKQNGEPLGEVRYSEPNNTLGRDNPLYNERKASLSAAEITFAKLNVKQFGRDELVLLEELGQGAFGKVVKCEILDQITAENTTISAVKYLKDDASDATRANFLREAEALASFNHPNIVSVIGVCVDDKGPPCIVLEFMEFGDLSHYIRERAGSYHAGFGGNGVLPEEVEFEPPSISFRKLVFMVRQIAAGMQYLSEKKFVHRDLASRNCLIAGQMVVKIGDFGLGHDISTAGGDYYRIDAQKMLPIRWLPPEALTVGKFTIQSDIWSFGILLWEVFTYGLQPYCGVENEEVIKRIRSFKVLGCPDGCPRKVYLLMRACWKYDVGKRMPFKKIQEILSGWLGEKGYFLDDAWEKMQEPIQISKDTIDSVATLNYPPIPTGDASPTVDAVPMNYDVPPGNAPPIPARIK